MFPNGALENQDTLIIRTFMIDPKMFHNIQVPLYSEIKLLII